MTSTQFLNKRVGDVGMKAGRWKKVGEQVGEGDADVAGHVLVFNYWSQR